MTNDPAPSLSPYSKLAKLQFCQKMALEDWRGLADLCGVTPSERRRFEQGHEPRDLWELVEERELLHQLGEHLETLRLHHVLEAMCKSETSRHHPASLPQRQALNPPPAPQQNLNTLFFDLDDLRHEVISASRTRCPVLCFAVPHKDVIIGDKVLEWLPYCFDGIACKPKRGLGPLVGNVETLIHWLRRFRDELADSNVGIHIDALRATNEILADFTRRTHEAFYDVPRRLVLVATIAPHLPTPPGVIRLNSPVFRPLDVENWAQRILAERGWPLILTQPWVDWIRGYIGAGEADRELDPSRTYQALDWSITDLHDDEAHFRRQLERLLE